MHSLYVNLSLTSKLLWDKLQRLKTIFKNIGFIKKAGA